MGLKSNSGIQLIEEKFRFDMFNSINNIIYPSSYSKAQDNNKWEINYYL